MRAKTNHHPFDSDDEHSSDDDSSDDDDLLFLLLFILVKSSKSVWGQERIIMGEEGQDVPKNVPDG